MYHNDKRTESEHLQFGENIHMFHARFVSLDDPALLSPFRTYHALVPKRFNLTMTDIITSVQIGIPFYLFM